MRDDQYNPSPSGDDLDIDVRLRSLTRARPRPGFADRVLTGVRVPLPRWMRSVRNGIRALVTGPRGWLILGSAALVTAATWGTALALGFHFRGYVTEGTRHAVREAAVPVLREGLALSQLQWNGFLNSVSGWFDGMFLSPTAFLLGYGIVALVSTVALKLLTAEPSRARGS